VLRVQSAHAEPGVDAPEVAWALAAELRLMADWMELEQVAVSGAGDLAPALTGAVAATGGAGSLLTVVGQPADGGAAG
jgi:hypothetical protein